MRALTRPGLVLLVASAGFAVLGDASSLFGPRLASAVTLSALTAFLGLAALFVGRREDGDVARVKLTRIAAIVWGVSLVVAALGAGMELAEARTGEPRAGEVMVALGGAAFAAIPVLAAWRLGARLARVAMATGAWLAGIAYVAGAFAVARGVTLDGATLPGDTLLLVGYWMTYRTYRPSRG